MVICHGPGGDEDCWKGPELATREEAVAAWNRRHYPGAPPQPVVDGRPASIVAVDGEGIHLVFDDNGEERCIGVGGTAENRAEWRGGVCVSVSPKTGDRCGFGAGHGWDHGSSSGERWPKDDTEG
jgi:hypothetical protein